jgi:hypothetical protein
MTDLDTLRRALRASPQPDSAYDPAFASAFDPAEIITRGRRLRWRRRAVAAGSGVCLAAAVFGAVAGVGRLTAPSPGPSRHTVTPIGPAGTRLGLAPSPSRGNATPSPSASATARPTPSATATPSPTATPVRALPSTGPTPTSTAPAAATAPGSAPTANPTSPTAATTSPIASASGNQPSPTPTATQ